MSVVRGTSLSNYPRLVTELGGDPVKLLRAAGIRPQDVDKYDVFIPFRAALRAIESAATSTATPDFGRRLAQRQGIEILGPVGVAARTAGTVADALAIFSTYMSAYSPAIGIGIVPQDDRDRSFVKVEFLLDRLPPCPQSIELSLGVSLRVFRFLMGPDYTPLSVQLTHDPLTPVADYVEYFGCRMYFAEKTAGFTIRTTDLRRALPRDDVAHHAIVEYLNSITERETGLTQSVYTIVRQLLPTGVATLEVIAEQFNLHPKTLQRRLADEGTTFATLVDQARKEAAERYLRDTQISLSHLTREVGYAEQSVLTRSCRRWFGCGPAAYRKRLRLEPVSGG
ncbi:MAG: AraC family transcriptional regulator [Mycobacterium sp.]|nr:AraC family transcriptional regulator [Mycobacterium sp.]MBV8290597.1 AraC family transcriptional regulator [Mycobacterium sp.]